MNHQHSAAQTAVAQTAAAIADAAASGELFELDIDF